MEDQKVRAERTWRKVKGWITDVTGAATEGYLPNIPPEQLLGGFQQLAGQTSNFRLSVVKGGEGEQAEDIQLVDLEKNLDLLHAGEIAGLNANFTAHLPGYDLDLHAVINPRWDASYGIELVWWSDQVFPDETDTYERFQALIEYLIGLKKLLHAGGLFVGPENLERPGPEAINWVEV